jgi:hypothetical protein
MVVAVRSDIAGTFPVSTDCTTAGPRAATAASAAAAPGRACPRAAKVDFSSGARRVSSAMNASTCRAGSLIPAMDKVSVMIARSVRPPMAATPSGSRPNRSRKTER